VKGICGIIYDCDGVLFESRQANLDYYNTVLAHLGEPAVTVAEQDRAHLCHTAASPWVFEVLLGAERAPEALSYAATLDFRSFIPAMTPEPGMAGTLATLAGRYPLAVATNRGNSMAEILAHFGLSAYFSVVVTSRDVTFPKPHPEMLLLAAKRLGLGAEQLLFVGDSELDREAARGAGIRFAAYGEGTTGEIRVSGHAELATLLMGG
jgi:HAD superfamily hydrolase (TIGR01509 family)